MSKEEKNLDVVVFNDEFEKVDRNARLYMTPGARKYFRRIVAGYAMLAVAGVIGIWGVTRHVNTQLRQQINTFLIENCKQSIPVVQRFNEAIKVDIEIQKDAKLLNIERGETKRSAVNDRAIKAKRDTLLHVPTLKECENRKAF